ncbi:MAG TPA: AraC family transcriptional regulator [Rhodocyclaceae bacterium]|nr:AraC family transcriptional regulator [Rhodocyclaceae bacterium]
MTVEGFALQLSRVQRVISYIGSHLDEDIALDRLADLACLSRSQLERLYCTKVGETPMATLRRLRLKRAHEEIRERGVALIDAGHAANYASQAAFTRAFVRQFGYSPSRIPSLVRSLERPPQLRLEILPAREVFQLPFAGRFAERRSDVGTLMGRLSLSGAKRWRTWHALDRDAPLATTPDTHVEVAYFVPANGQPHTVRGVDRVVREGGLFAVHEALVWQQPTVLMALAERIRAELGCQITLGLDKRRALIREINVSGYTPPQERRISLYIPVAPLGSAPLVQPQPTCLAPY